MNYWTVSLFTSFIFYYMISMNSS